GDADLSARVRPLAVKIARITLAEGVDPDGGVLGEAGPNGITNSFKEWWPQAEAAVGFLNAYQISGDAAFWRATEKTWGFIETRLVDRGRGEWLIGVNRDGSRHSGPKASFWKCPYHNGRACMELIDRLRAGGHQTLPADPR
ncbi:MAG TPA: AGE family epimerase/isomerase, partial [Opitutus sp.]|nr:AGE family epimerase/isomerase [Opitutus sp.]